MSHSAEAALVHDARAISNYFLDRADTVGRPISVMSLLKVLYFAHSWYLAEFDKPLVAQPFEAWKYGPVCRVVYDQLKDCGSRSIKKRLLIFDAERHGFFPAPYDLVPDTKLFLDNIFDYYTQFHPFLLSDFTHEKESPWEKVWREAERHAVPGMIIPNELISSWFKSTRGILAASGQKGTLT